MFRRDTAGVVALVGVVVILVGTYPLPHAYACVVRYFIYNSIVRCCRRGGCSCAVARLSGDGAS